MKPEDILTTYDRIARGYARSRDRTLFERGWLDRMLAHAPGRQVLDLGCGTGLPIARYLTDRRCRVTGVDGAATMMATFSARTCQTPPRSMPTCAILTWASGST